jgi:hypothetical protein
MSSSAADISDSALKKECANTSKSMLRAARGKASESRYAAALVVSKRA